MNVSSFFLTLIMSTKLQGGVVSFFFKKWVLLGDVMSSDMGGDKRGRGVLWLVQRGLFVIALSFVQY